jgi:hypothetical protein
MKLAALILLVAIFGKISAVPLRIGYYRAAAPQSLEEDSEEADTEISQEDFSTADEIADDDDDSEEHDLPPKFQNLFPLPQANSPGHNFPLAVMMSEISAQGWNVPKRPHQTPKEQSRARDELDMLSDDDDDDSDEDDDEEEDEEEDDVPEDDEGLPDWNKLFPNVEAEANSAPAAGVPIDAGSSYSSGAPSFRSAIPGARVVYVPARQLRQQLRARPQVSSAPRQMQYIMRAPVTQQRQRPQIMYMAKPSSSYMNRQPIVMRGRPQQQVMLAHSASSRRPQQSQYVYYMPVRRGSYSPYTSAYVPRYRY